MNNINTQKNDPINDTAIVLFQEKDPKKILQARTTAVAKEAFRGLQKMGIAPSTCSAFTVFFSSKLTHDINVRKKSADIILKVPLLFLLETEDFTTPSLIMPWLSQRFKTTDNAVYEKQKMSLNFFSDLLQKDPIKAKKAKKFILYHELAHIFHGDIFHNISSNKESIKIEKRADLTAAEFCEEAEGGTYLFSILSNYEMEKPKTHPSSLERAAYLQLWNK